MTGSFDQNRREPAQGVDVAEAIVPTKSYTLQEVEQHKTWEDCWTIIDGQVYDITEWVTTHPGGNVIRLALGRDATTLVESYHPPSSLMVLKSYLGTKVKHIGKFAGAPEPSGKVEFFTDVRKRVDSYLKQRGVGYHYYEWLGIGEALLTLFLFILATIYKVYFGSVLASVALGVLTGRMGFLMHMGNHAAVSKKSKWNEFIGMFMDIIGSTHMTWQFEHQVAHHCYPNEFGHDNDCEIGTPLLRFHPSIKRAWWHKWNHLITFSGMPFGAMKWYLTDFINLYTLRISNVDLNATKKDLVIVYIFKISYSLIHFFAPLYFWGLGFAMLTWTIQLAIGALYMEHIFIVNHIQDGLIPPENLHWAARQVISTANWCSGSHFWNIFSGGLNHQVEHHLFPATSYYLYPDLVPIVQQCCKEHGLKYTNFNSYPQAWIATFSYLRDLGTEKFDNYGKSS